MIKILLTLIFPIVSFSLVDMKNANFTDSFVDLVVPGSSFELKIERTYNSRSLFNGLFGFGWCTKLETSLEPMPEGTLKLTSCGSGLRMIFSKQGKSTQGVTKTVDRILQAIKKENPKIGDSVLTDLKNSLKDDWKLRDDFSKKYEIAGQSDKGVAYYSQAEKIIFDGSEYTRFLTGGVIQKFDKKGRMVYTTDKSGNYIKLVYEDKLIKSITDNNGNKLSLFYFKNAKVKSITGPNKIAVAYEFDGLVDLARVTNQNGEVLNYKYDSLHNLTKIDYPDKTSKNILYDNNKDWVVGFKDRKSCQEKYDYGFDEKSPRDHYWSQVKKTCGNKVVNESKYEFWFSKERGNQGKYLQKVAITINGNLTETKFHHKFNRPISIVNNDLASYFTYDENTGLLKKKRVGKKVSEYKYDDKCKKVNYVKQSKESTVFEYDNKCNLVSAVSTDGKKVELGYDENGRLASIIDQARRHIKISYNNTNGRPKKIENPGTGSISVDYKNDGSFGKIVSPEGDKVALQITFTFNSLLDVLEPVRGNGIEL